MRVLYTRQVDEMHEEHYPEKRRLETPEIFYTEGSRLQRARDHSPRVYTRKDNYGGNSGAWDDPPQERNPGQPGNQSTRSVRHVDPNIPPEPVHNPLPRASIVDGTHPDVTHISRPPTYDDQNINSYRRLRNLTLPGVGTA